MRRTFICALTCLGLALNAHAEDKPLWELGVGLTVLDFPDYRGSDERTTYLFPVPYGVYRGKVLKVERERVRGMFYENDRLNLHLSLNGSVPVDSSRNEARQGMPDLDATLEIGPNLEINLFRTANDDIHVGLRLPVRTVIATDLRHTHNEGWTFHPNLNVDLRNTFLGEAWKVGFSAGPLYGDKRYHNYYYGVSPEFATPLRPAYVADGGYAGIQAAAAVRRYWQRARFAAFVRWDSVSGAAFNSSPLVRQEDTLTAGFIVLWALRLAERSASSDE